MKKIILMLSLLILAACKDSNRPNVEVIQDFMESPAVKSQEADDFFPDKAGGARVPPEHTVPVGFKVYHPGFNPEQAKADKNPFEGQMSDEVLLTGQKFYETNCTVCHGQKANGQGAIVDKMPNKPPSLLTEKIRGWKDGQIYQVITMGQGTMGSYASHIPQQYRWQVVNYVRHLQKNNQ